MLRCQCFTKEECIIAIGNTPTLPGGCGAFAPASGPCTSSCCTQSLPSLPIRPVTAYEHIGRGQRRTAGHTPHTDRRAPSTRLSTALACRPASCCGSPPGCAAGAHEGSGAGRGSGGKEAGDTASRQRMVPQKQRPCTSRLPVCLVRVKGQAHFAVTWSRARHAYLHAASRPCMHVSMCSGVGRMTHTLIHACTVSWSVS
jgi:hypothetical protein